MAGLLSRFTTFLPNTTILSNDHNQELNRIVNLLNGTTTNLKTVLKTSDAGDPPLELDQLSTGPIQKWLQGGILKAQISNAGNYLFNQSGGFIGDQNGNELLKFAVAASAVNEITVQNAAAGGGPVLASTGGDTNIPLTISPKGTGQLFIGGSSPVRLPTGASPSNDDDAARKKYVDDRKVSFSASFFILDPSTATLSSLDFGELIIPGGGSYTVTKCKVARTGGSHTAGGSVTFIVQQQGVGTKATLVLDDTNNAVNTVYTDDVGDFTVAENVLLGVLVSARSGTVSERNVTVTIEGFRTGF